MEWRVSKDEWMQTLELIEKVVNLVSQLNEENALLNERVRVLEREVKQMKGGK